MSLLISEPPFPLSPAVATARDRFNSGWLHLQELREHARVELARFDIASTTEITPKFFEAKRRARFVVIEVLKAQIEFLRKFHSEWPKMFNADRILFTASAEKAQQDIEAEITAALIGLGFPAATPDGATGLYVAPDRYARQHPRVRVAANTAMDVATLSNNNPFVISETGAASVIAKYETELQSIAATM